MGAGKIRRMRGEKSTHILSLRFNGLVQCGEKQRPRSNSPNMPSPHAGIQHSNVFYTPPSDEMFTSPDWHAGVSHGLPCRRRKALEMKDTINVLEEGFSRQGPIHFSRQKAQQKPAYSPGNDFATRMYYRMGTQERVAMSGKQESTTTRCDAQVHCTI